MVKMRLVARLASGGESAEDGSPHRGDRQQPAADRRTEDRGDLGRWCVRDEVRGPVAVLEREEQRDVGGKVAREHNRRDDESDDADRERPRDDADAARGEIEEHQCQRQQLQPDRDRQDRPGDGRPRAQRPRDEAEGDCDEVEVAERDLEDRREEQDERGRCPRPRVARQRTDEVHRDRRRDDSVERHEQRGRQLERQRREKREGHRRRWRVVVFAVRTERYLGLRGVEGLAREQVTCGEHVRPEVVAERRLGEEDPERREGGQHHHHDADRPHQTRATGGLGLHALRVYGRAI